MVLCKGHEPNNITNYELFHLTEAGISRTWDFSDTGTTGYRIVNGPLLWARRWMRPGDKLEFPANMVRFNKSTGAALQEFPFGNTIELLDIYDQYTFPSGITLHNVAHFRVHVHGTGPAEEMMFSDGNLVYWKEITNNPDRQVKSGQYAGQRWESWVSSVLPENYTINPIYPAWFQPHLTPVPQPPSVTALLSGGAVIPDPIVPDPPAKTPRKRRQRTGSFLYHNTRLEGAPRWEELIFQRNIAHPVGWDVYMEEFWADNPPPFVYNNNPGWKFEIKWITAYAGLINRDARVLQPGLYAAVCEVNPTIQSHPEHVTWNFRFNLGDRIVDHRHAPLNAVDHAGVCELPIRVTEPVEVHSFGLMIQSRASAGSTLTSRLPPTPD
jgi:hypothetical protein